MSERTSNSGQSLDSKINFDLNGKFLTDFIEDPKNFIYETVKFSILIRPVQDFSIGLTGFKHWTLEVEFENRSLYLEANKDANGNLAPSISFMKPNCIENIHAIPGTKNLSAVEIVKAAVQNEQNNVPYDAISANCQTWINKLASKLGFYVNISTVRTWVTVFSTFSTLAFGIPGAVLSGAAIAATKWLSSGSASINNNYKQN